MKKVIIQVLEKVTYDEEVIFEQPKGMSDGDFDKIVEAAEREANRFDGGVDDFISELVKKGIKVIHLSSNFPESPHGCELEVLDIREKKESE